MEENKKNCIELRVNNASDEFSDRGAKINIKKIEKTEKDCNPRRNCDKHFMPNVDHKVIIPKNARIVLKLELASSKVTPFHQHQEMKLINVAIIRKKKPSESHLKTCM